MRDRHVHTLITPSRALPAHLGLGSTLSGDDVDPMYARLLENEKCPFLLRCPINRGDNYNDYMSVLPAETRRSIPLRREYT